MEKTEEKKPIQKKEIEKKEILIERTQKISETRLKETLEISVDRLIEKEFVKKMRRILDKLKNVDYPEWVNKPWARIRPHDNFYDDWIKKWKDIIIIFCRKKGRFTCSVADIMINWPFYDGAKKLNIDDIRNMIDKLVEEEVAKWLDKRKDYFIVYWIPLEELAIIIKNEAQRVGLLVLREKILREILEDLPNGDIYRLLSILIKEGIAEWIAEGQAIKFKTF